jgi:hypothetical protein
LFPNGIAFVRLCRTETGIVSNCPFVCVCSSSHLLLPPALCSLLHGVTLLFVYSHFFFI